MRTYVRIPLSELGWSWECEFLLHYAAFGGSFIPHSLTFGNYWPVYSGVFQGMMKLRMWNQYNITIIRYLWGHGKKCIDSIISYNLAGTQSRAWHWLKIHSASCERREENNAVVMAGGSLEHDWDRWWETEMKWLMCWCTNESNTFECVPMKQWVMHTLYVISHQPHNHHPIGADPHAFQKFSFLQYFFPLFLLVAFHFVAFAVEMTTVMTDYHSHSHGGRSNSRCSLPMASTDEAHVTNYWFVTPSDVWPG